METRKLLCAKCKAKIRKAEAKYKKGQRLKIKVVEIKSKKEIIKIKHK